jgi:hypothetical protein
VVVVVVVVAAAAAAIQFLYLSFCQQSVAYNKQALNVYITKGRLKIKY